MQNKFHSYSDPGHGWGKVPRALLVELGISDKITPHSYQRGDFVYLEEDCDLSTFFTAYRDVNGCDPQFRHHSAEKLSKIRGYASYVPS